MARTVEQFSSTLADAEPPEGLSSELLALWHDARGDWNAAHKIAQDIDSESGALIHAYLHRKEGDLANAGYWYRRAGRPAASDALVEEWKRLVQEMLER
jgi:hypothetical protein